MAAWAWILLLLLLMVIVLSIWELRSLRASREERRARAAERERLRRATDEQLSDALRRRSQERGRPERRPMSDDEFDWEDGEPAAEAGRRASGRR